MHVLNSFQAHYMMHMHDRALADRSSHAQAQITPDGFIHRQPLVWFRERSSKQAHVLCAHAFSCLYDYTHRVAHHDDVKKHY